MNRIDARNNGITRSSHWRLDDTSDDQINAYLRKYSLYKGAYDCLDLPKPKKGVYIVNIDRNPNGEGTHWTLVNNLEPDRCEYFDPYGQVPNSETHEFMDSTGKRLFYSDADYQSIPSHACGYFCMYVAKNLLKGRKMGDVIGDFSTRVNENERFLQNYFSK